MGSLLSNLLFNSVAFGLNGSLETLVSQAYGAIDFEMCAVYLHRSRLVLVVFLIPCSVILLHSEQLLLMLGQPEGASKVAQTYIEVYLPGLFLFVLNDGYRRFMNSLGRSDLPFYI